MSEPDPLTVDLDTMPLQPQRWMYVLSLILRRHNWQHAAKAKGVSHRTNEARARLCIWVFRFLRDNPVKTFKLDPRSFSGRHVDLLMAHWQAEAKAGRLAPSTIPTYYSHLKTFTRWIDKPKLLKPISAYFDDPALYKRSYCATEDKSWHAMGVDVFTVIRDVEAYDFHAAACLWLMVAFGLRFKESLMLRPHADVVTPAQAGESGASADQADGPVADYLDSHRGTKGGRRRYIPIDDELRRHAVDYARHVCKGTHASVSDQTLTLVQAMRRLRYVMERFGITKRDLHVVPHGLRHQFAGRGYTLDTGVLPPVAGGPFVEPALDARARDTISQQLGHGRRQIVNAYLGRRLIDKPAGGPNGDHRLP